MHLYNNKIIYNLITHGSYYQTKSISNLIYEHLQKPNIKNKIKNKNVYNDRYNNNNDLFIHIRLTDAAHLNPGLTYYTKAISSINFENIYIATDDINHPIIKDLQSLYKNVDMFIKDEIETIQFGSTCKNIILSHGSFSSVIGYLAYNSTIYYPEYESDKIWYGDMFSIEGWNKIIHK